MVYLAPCFNCAADKATCERRATMREAIKGLGITSAKFNCPDRQAKFRRGQRVSFYWRYWEQTDNYGSSEEFYVTFRGTIMREMPGNRRFSIRVDQQHEDYDLKPSDVLKNAEFTSVRPDDIRALGEPDRPMCRLCSAYDDAEDIAAKCYGHGDLSNVAGEGCFNA